MIPTDIIDELVKRLREAGGANVESVILFGSAVAGDYHPGLSNLNIFVFWVTAPSRHCRRSHLRPNGGTSRSSHRRFA